MKINLDFSQSTIDLILGIVLILSLIITIILIFKSNYEEGIQGVIGSKGLKGGKGQKGIKGIQGEKGPTGDKGDKGNLSNGNLTIGKQGPKGYKGPQGPRGFRGFRGDIGDKGYKGKQGDLGDKGPPGNTGRKGPKGFKGFNSRIDMVTKLNPTTAKIALTELKTDNINQPTNLTYGCIPAHEKEPNKIMNNNFIIGLNLKGKTKFGKEYLSGQGMCAEFKIVEKNKKT